MTSVIISGARTPMGKLLGSLAGFTGSDLGGYAIAEAVSRAGIRHQQVDSVLMGQVLTAGEGQLPARRAATKGGLPMTVPALTVNKVCLSGIQAIILADQYIRSGLYTTIVAGGQESMSSAPHLLFARTGYKYGAISMADHMEIDGLYDAYTKQSMGQLVEQQNDVDGFSRESQDTFAAQSHSKAVEAYDAGVFGNEIVPLKVSLSREEPFVVDTDEALRADTTSAALATLPPAFQIDGTITAGNSSPISDGACALVIMDKGEAERQGLEWIAEIGSPGMVSGPRSTLQHQPAEAIRDACRREGIEPKALDLVEINEAFAAVGLSSIENLGIDPERVNVNGGAIALGHPLGMSGARLVLHLALELRRRGGGIGAAALCGGGGQGDALIVHVQKKAD